MDVATSTNRQQRRGAFHAAGLSAPEKTDAIVRDTTNLSSRWLANWTLTLLTVGLAARLIRFLLCFPLWDDEAFLAVNLIDRSYLELAQPLDFHQVAPIGFLWIQATAVRLLGFNELALRLFPLLCGLGSMALFWRMSRRLLTGYAQLAAIGIFAVSYPAIRYSAEAKPYGSDLFVSLVFLTLALAWQGAGRARWLAALAIFAPMGVALSLPAAFVGGGLSLAIAGRLAWLRRAPQDPSGSTVQRRSWLGWAAFNTTLLASFVALQWLTNSAAEAAEGEVMRNWWRDSFPPLDQLSRLPLWLLETHTSWLLAYPVGGERGASVLTFIACAAGLIALWRTGRRGWALAAVAPLALNMVAASLQKYPYGGHPKFSQYIAPAICLLAGLGCATLLALIAQRWPKTARLNSALLMGLLLIGAGSIARDFAWPFKARNDLRQRDFARWFWPSAQFDGEVACLKTDLQLDFSRAAFHDLNWSAMYLCNQRIYSPRHARDQAIQWDQIAMDHPLTCVEYFVPRADYDVAAKQRWLDEMRQRYQLTSETRWAFPCHDKRETRLINLDYVLIYRFVPRTDVAAAERSAP